MSESNLNITGLTNAQAEASARKNGKNELTYKTESGMLHSIISLFKEPMILLLLAAATIYFISGNIGDGLFMTTGIFLVAAISLYQENRSKNALAALKDLTRPKCKVIRNGKVESISSADIVLGDFIMVEEGTSIPADATIIQANDFSVNESILTGESMPLEKNQTAEDHFIYQGTWVAGGLAIGEVIAIGNQTKLGKIGKSLESIEEETTPLQQQINQFVKLMALSGIVVFFIVWAINYYRSHDLPDSLLKALTLAMSILPEEIPVAFTTFMALGAWRLMKMGIIVKQTKTVETLGSATVICTDKTGTITENKMSLAKLFVWKTKKAATPDQSLTPEALELLDAAMWASEPIPFDAMEIALHNAYKQFQKTDVRAAYKMIHEYPLSGRPPMMTHVFENEAGHRIIAAKGAPEAMLEVAHLTDTEKEAITKTMHAFAADGYRVLGVATTEFSGTDFPAAQQDFKFTFKGLVAFYDPPKKNITNVFNAFYDAGIDVKIVTGDNAATTSTIARQIQFKGAEQTMNGEELMQLNQQDLEKQVKDTFIFSRMFPDAKLKIINALKANGEVVAMTGDGVNDGPALKSAHIGIAMGKKGTEIAKQASSLILIDDDLARMVDAIAMGRKIYVNLKKAIQYIISIHIPIILTVFIPLALNWIYPSIFTPVHIIFLELIMGPTCSIIYENEPMEKNLMQQQPRPFTTTFFNFRELLTSIIQGLAITAGTLFMYQYAVQSGSNEAVTRTMVFTTLIAANIFLTLINRSFYYSLFTTLKYKNNLIPLIIGITILLTASLLLFPPFTQFFGFERLTIQQTGWSTLAGFISVIWYEGIKWLKRRSADKA
jgi:P-type Ca2+ transporter type 2C